ncbi:MAG: hypothetical protein CEE38_17020 [Planctomycetes bacterium B3_Pla]|nr:MAG: hypothetical protein CEE38_17020 [Planctomycetes bacterium B3_Pla]
MGTDPNPHAGQKQDSMPQSPDRYEKGLELAEAGKHQEALVYMQECLRATPHDAQVLNDTGAILYCLGRSDEAIDHFVKARSFKNDNAEIVWNLAEAYLAAGRASEALQLFDQMDRMGILNVDILNRAATIFLDQDNKGDAIEMLLRSLRIWPDQEMLHPILQVVRSKRPKVAFICGDDGTKLSDEIAEFVKARFETYIFDGQAEEELYELMKWSDISWFESCTNLAARGSKQPKVCKNIVAVRRCNGFEQWLEQIDWGNIDIFAPIGSSFVKDALVSGVSELESQTSIAVIPNGVNLEKFTFTNRQRGKNIAFLSDLGAAKNLAFILECMQKLHHIDPEYRLFFGREFEDKAFEEYISQMVDALELGGVVFFDGRQENVCSWLEDKHYIVSTGIFESSSAGLLEAMACGLKPAIHSFPEADKAFPSEFLFDSPERFCERICSGQYEPDMYRRFVEENYPLKNQLEKINKILIHLEAEINSQQTGGRLCNDLQNQDLEKAGSPAQSVAPALEAN